MISLQQRISAFTKLGEAISAVIDNNISSSQLSPAQNILRTEISEAFRYNGWYDNDNVLNMVNAIANQLSAENISKWLAPYSERIEHITSPSTIAVIMAGNIPLVGFHDFLSVLISGNKILAKLSSDDNRLLPAIADILFEIEPAYTPMVKFTNTKIESFDAIIATGSNNTGRYFEYYFGKYKNIIRKNRSGIAVITGDESDLELQEICNDIQQYYGLGCRNVSHIFVPQNYDFTALLAKLSKNQNINNNHKYFNNYEYNKAIMLVNGTQHYDSGNTLITENIAFSSPVSVIYYTKYNDINSVNKLLTTEAEKIQCIVSKSNKISNAGNPGTTQQPELWDYSDNIDTMEFLIDVCIS